MLLILFPRLPNGNVLWSCDSCGNTAEVSYSETTAVALYCACNRKINPQCNDDWYNKGLHLKRIPIEIRLKGGNYYKENK
tara:strand:+ start:274 stop:513 length:240 start_codon:yes stop_codon:yes gene_type:complete